MHCQRLSDHDCVLCVDVLLNLLPMRMQESLFDPDADARLQIDLAKQNSKVLKRGRPGMGYKWNSCAPKMCIDAFQLRRSVAPRTKSLIGYKHRQFCLFVRKEFVESRWALGVCPSCCKNLLLTVTWPRLFSILPVMSAIILGAGEMQQPREKKMRSSIPPLVTLPSLDPYAYAAAVGGEDQQLDVSRIL